MTGKMSLHRLFLRFLICILHKNTAEGEIQTSDFFVHNRREIHSFGNDLILTRLVLINFDTILGSSERGNE